MTDEKGAYAPNAQIYIYGIEAGKFIENREHNGSASFELPPGTYRIYSATSQNDAGFIDHYVSPEARVIVAAKTGPSDARNAAPYH